jgi:hypothetical protein
LSSEPFLVKDCALIAIATGVRAHSLKELRDRLLTITSDSIYLHFWGDLLEPRFEEREYIPEQIDDFRALLNGAMISLNSERSIKVPRNRFIARSSNADFRYYDDPGSLCLSCWTGCH